jgi:hypothetical protein
MNDSETHSPAHNPDLESQIAALQRQVLLLLLALIVVAATIVSFLYYQSHILTYDLNLYRPKALQIIQTYARDKQTMENFDKQLETYAMTHPGFQPILRKYGWVPPATTPAQ